MEALPDVAVDSWADMEMNSDEEVEAAIDSSPEWPKGPPYTVRHENRENLSGRGSGRSVST